MGSSVRLPALLKLRHWFDSAYVRVLRTDILGKVPQIVALLSQMPRLSFSGYAMRKRLRANVHGARWFGRGGLVGKAGLRHSAFVCALGTLRPQRRRFQRGEYRPTYLADTLAMHIGKAGIEEPIWVYLDFMQRAFREQQFRGHPIGIQEFTGLALTTTAPLNSSASQTVIQSGVIAARSGPKPLL